MGLAKTFGQAVDLELKSGQKANILILKVTVIS